MENIEYEEIANPPNRITIAFLSSLMDVLGLYPDSKKLIIDKLLSYNLELEIGGLILSMVAVIVLILNTTRPKDLDEIMPYMALLGIISCLSIGSIKSGVDINKISNIISDGTNVFKNLFITKETIENFMNSIKNITKFDNIMLSL